MGERRGESACNAPRVDTSEMENIRSRVGSALVVDRVAPVAAQDSGMREFFGEGAR